MTNKSFALHIYIIALMLRFIPVFLARGLGIGLDDMFQYDMLARSIVSGNGFRWYAQEDLNQLAPFVNFDLSSVKEYDPIRGIPTSFRAPLYPTFLAIVYFFSGNASLPGSLHVIPCFLSILSDLEQKILFSFYFSPLSSFFFLHSKNLLPTAFCSLASSLA